MALKSTKHPQLSFVKQAQLIAALLCSIFIVVPSFAQSLSGSRAKPAGDKDPTPPGSTPAKDGSTSPVRNPDEFKADDAMKLDSSKAAGQAGAKATETGRQLQSPTSSSFDGNLRQQYQGELNNAALSMAVADKEAKDKGLSGDERDKYHMLMALQAFDPKFGSSSSGSSAGGSGGKGGSDKQAAEPPASSITTPGFSASPASSPSSIDMTILSGSAPSKQSASPPNNEVINLKDALSSTTPMSSAPTKIVLNNWSGASGAEKITYDETRAAGQGGGDIGHGTNDTQANSLPLVLGPARAMLAQSNSEASSATSDKGLTDKQKFALIAAAKTKKDQKSKASGLKGSSPNDVLAAVRNGASGAAHDPSLFAGDPARQLASADADSLAEVNPEVPPDIVGFAPNSAKPIHAREKTYQSEMGIHSLLPFALGGLVVLALRAYVGLVRRKREDSEIVHHEDRRKNMDKAS